MPLIRNGVNKSVVRGSSRPFPILVNLLPSCLDCSRVSATSMPFKIDVSELVSMHQVEIWRYLRFLGCDATMAEDLAQDTFVAVLRKPFADRGRAASASYLRQVARNLLLKSKRGPTAGEFEEMEASWQRFRGEDGGNTYVEALRACVEGLEGKSARVMQLIYQQGRSLQATATAVGLRVNGVRTLLQRVRRGLRSCVTRRMQT